MRRVLILILIGVVFILSGCNKGDPKTLCEKDQLLNERFFCEEVEFVFEMSHSLVVADETEYYTVSANYIDIYTNSHDRDISYVGVKDLFKALDEILYDFEVVEINNDVLRIEFGSFIDGEYEFQMEFNGTENTITINRFDIFQYMNEDYKRPISYAIEVRSYNTYGSPNEVVINLNEYEIDIIDFENDFYMPLYLADIFLMGDTVNLYETENELIVYNQASNPKDILSNYDLKESTNLKSMIRNTENFLRLYYNYFYGLKEYKNMTSFDDLIYSVNLPESETYQDFHMRIDSMLISLDDAHTRFLYGGYNDISYERINEYPVGSRLEEFSIAKEENMCDFEEENKIEVFDDTMHVSLNRFYIENDFITKFLSLKNNVDFIEIDLRCNTGGKLYDAIVALTLVTTKLIPYDSINPMTQVHTTMTIASPTTRTSNAEYTILTSGVTYSAANYFTSVLYDLNVATIIGEDTAGGAGALQTVILPDGSIVTASSNLILTNMDREIIEEGIDVNKEN